MRLSLTHRGAMHDWTDLLVFQLEHLFDAEQRLVDALPRMINAASDRDVQRALSNHSVESDTHLTRLRKVFALLGRAPRRRTCCSMKGLIREGGLIVRAADNGLRDAGLIATAQRAEYDEIGQYTAARRCAQRMDHGAIAAVLFETLAEEHAASRRLAELAIRVVEQRAQHIPAQNGALASVAPL